MSTLLAKAISFRLLIKQLSKNEFLKFMAKIFDINQSNLIATSLFNQFVHESSITNPNANNINNINSILSEIIQSRKPNDLAESTNTATIKLDTLPKSLIGNISSFLTQNDYFRFEKTNRKIFIGCNSPNKLTTLNLSYIANYSSIKLQQFTSMKRLIINVNQFHQFKLPQNGQYIMNQLQYLLLDGNCLADFDIEPFMNQNSINIENIKSITFSNFGQRHISSRFNNDKLWKLLLKFKNIECLRLYNVIPTNPIPKETLQQLYDLNPLLYGLSVDAGWPVMNNDLINIFGNKLRFLLHSNRSNRSIDFSNINFINLEQVTLVTPSAKTVNDILKSAKNIRKFCLYPDSTFQSNSPSSKELKIIIPQIFKCKLLQYFDITVNNENYLSILDGIEIGVFETKTMKKKQMKIRVKLRKHLQIDLNNIIINIGRIIKWLEASKIRDFMFIYDMKWIDTNHIKSLNTNHILQQFNDISSNIEVQYNQKCFVITNKNCKICFDSMFFRSGIYVY